MALSITKSDEVIEVNNIVLTVYSQPGLGKTSLAFTAENPLLLDFDQGSYRAVDRKDVVQITSWQDVAQIERDDLEPYDTIILDTAGKALDFLGQDIVNSSPSLGYQGALNQRGWGQLGMKFKNFLNRMKSFEKDVVLICHMEEKTSGEEIKERLKVQGQSKALIETDSDAMARIIILNKTRQLVFSSTEAAYGKDPVGIGMVQIPNGDRPEFSSFLADQIKAIKDGLNSLSEAQVERKSEIEWFTEHLPQVVTDEGINDLLARAKKVGKDVSRMLVSRADELGLVFDAETRQYVYLDALNPDEELEGEDA